jgi:mono/diheme cytochrome c family protein
MRSKVPVTVLATFLAATAAAGCTRTEEETQGSRPPEARAEPEARPHAPAEPTPAARAPAAAAAADPARGRALYQSYCASCHGPEGDADGPAGQALDPRPARHSDGATMNALSNEHLVRVIRDGGPAVGKSPLMAPWGGTLTDAQIRDVVAFVRSLAQPPYTGPAP